MVVLGGGLFLKSEVPLHPGRLAGGQGGHTLVFVLGALIDDADHLLVHVDQVPASIKLYHTITSTLRSN